MRTITRKLMELAPNLAATYCAQAIVNWNEWNYLQAKRCILQAIKADPNYELGHTWYGFMLCLWGDAIEGRRQYEISRRLAPSKVTVYRGLGRSYYLERRYTKAIELLKKALEQEPHHGAAYSYLGAVYRAIGEYTNAINHFERRDLLYGNNESKTKERYDALRRAFKEGGVRGYWQEEWKQTEKNLNGDIYCDKAIIQIHLGNTNAALSWLEKAYENQKPQGSLHDNSHLPYLFEDECWDSLYDDLRFRALLDKMGLTKVMPPRKK